MEVTLVMFTQNGERRDFEVKALPAVVGRSGDCDFQIPLGIISRKHCKLSMKGERLFVRDLGSSNGTYVNNKRVQETELQAGDTLIVGPVIFTVVIDGRPADIKTIATILEPVKNPDRKKSASPKDEMRLDDSDTLDVLPDDDSQVNPLAELEALSKQKRP